MWNWLMNLLPDLKSGTLEVRDLLNLLMTVLAARLAYGAIVLGRRQVQMMDKEHGRWLVEQAKRTNLRVTGHAQKKTYSNSIQPDPLTIGLKVKNNGDKTADGFYWEVLVPRNLYGAVTFEDEDGFKIEPRVTHLSEREEDTYDKVDGHYPHKLFAFSQMEIIRLSVQNTFPRTAEFWIKWRISFEDGTVPAQGHSKIHYRRLPDEFYEVKHDDPAKSEDLVAPPDRVSPSPVATTRSEEQAS